MKIKTWINLLVVLVLLAFSLGMLPSTREIAQAATLVRVKPGGSTSAGCGSTWATACELQAALLAAGAGTEIWVAAGTYKPGTNREDTFQLKSGVALYGGFAGTETTRVQRDWESNSTVLSGDIGVLGNISDNIYHVVTGSGVDDTGILDGFTITGGNADGDAWPDWKDRGGGMFNQEGSPSLSNISFIGNKADDGGGLYNEFSNPTLTQVIFKNNQAVYGGGMGNGNSSNPLLINVTFIGNNAIESGGMDNVSSSPVLINVTFSGNTAENIGGGMSNYSYSNKSNPSLTNVIFRGNSAGDSGGGMSNEGGSPFMTNVILIGNVAKNGGGMANISNMPTLTNVTLSGNTAGEFGGGMYNRSSNPIITNSIMWGNTAETSGPQIYNHESSSETSTPFLTYSDVQGGCVTIPGNDCSGEGNIDANPLFMRKPHPGPDGTWGTADDDFGDLRLRYGSPAIDSGDNTAPGLAGITTDLDGNSRFFDVPGIEDKGVGPPPVVDMGAYEAVDVVPLEIYLPMIVR